MNNRIINILLIKDGEIIPLKKNDRRMRVSHLMHYFKKNGYKTTWITSNFLHSQRTFIKKTDLRNNKNIITLKSIGYFNNKSPRRLIHTIFFSLELFIFLFKNIKKYTHICIAYPTPESLFATLIFTNHLKIPLIIDVRDIWPPKTKNGFIYFLYSKFTFCLMKKIKNKSSLYLLSVSEGLENWFRESFPRLNPLSSTICPIGSDEHFYGKKVLHKNTLNIIYVGSLGVNYDVTGIIKSILSIKQKDILKIHIIGNGEQFNKLKEMSSLRSNIKMYGFLNKKIMLLIALLLMRFQKLFFSLYIKF